MKSEATCNKSTVQTIQVPDLAALDALEVLGSLAKPVRGKLVLRLAGLDPQEQRDWQRRLHRKVFACGCGMGAGFGLGGIITFIAWRLAVSSGLSSLTWGDIPLALLVLVAGVGIGKLIGLATARITLHRSKLYLREIVLSRINVKEV
jgi:hypothetical protein